MKMSKKRICLKDRALPDYTKGEEVFNMVTHIVGGAVGIATLVLCVIVSALRGSLSGVLCSIVFGFSMIALYTMSSVYHGLHVNMAKKVFQIIDHCTIYFLIAGTYTPILVCGMVPINPWAGWVTFGVLWGLTALAVTLTAGEKNTLTPEAIVSVLKEKLGLFAGDPLKERYRILRRRVLLADGVSEFE